MKRIAKEIVAVLLMLLLGRVLVFFGFDMVGYSYESSLGMDNSNAKLAFTNTATIITKYEARGGDPRALDGAYWGSLYCIKQPEWQDIDFDSRENAFDFDNALKSLMGSSSREWAGCYFIIIRDGMPLRTYWARGNELLYYGERLAQRAKTHDLGGEFYNGGERFGSYPEEMTRVVKEPPEWLDITAADNIRRAGRTFAKNLPMFLTFVFPLFVYALIRLVKWGVRKIKGKKPYKADQ